jgi:hypothetical protein
VNDGCPECPSPVEHEMEECSAARLYQGGTNGACEHYFLTHDTDGIALAIAQQIGFVSDEDYYRELRAGVELMHEVSACGA